MSNKIVIQTDEPDELEFHFDDIKSQENEHNEKIDIQFSELNVSTMTINTSVCSVIDINVFKNFLKLSENGIAEIDDGNILKSIFQRRNGMPSSTKRKEPTLTKTGKIRKKSFQNQITALIYMENRIKPLNVKVFSNGQLTITGCKSIEEGQYAVSVLINSLRNTYYILHIENTQKKIYAVENIENIKEIPLKQSMINFKYKVNFLIDQYKLVELLERLKGNETKIKHVRYEPDHYAGVILQIYLDKENPEYIAYHRLKKHKRDLTFSIFESGSINLVVNQHGIEAKDKYYNFLNELLINNYNTIAKIAQH